MALVISKIQEQLWELIQILKKKNEDQREELKKQRPIEKGEQKKQREIEKEK